MDSTYEIVGSNFYDLLITKKFCALNSLILIISWTHKYFLSNMTSAIYLLECG